MLNTVHLHAVNQEMLVDRALTLKALIGDPLVRDFRSAPRLLDALLAAHAEYLLQF